MHLSFTQASWHPLVDMFVVGRYPKADSRNEKGKRALSNSDRGVIDFFDVNSEKPAFNLVDPSRKGLFPVCVDLTSCFYEIAYNVHVFLSLFQLNAFSSDGSYLLSTTG